jgi:hypothetical protein
VVHTLRCPHQDPVRTSPIPTRATCSAHLILPDLIIRIIKASLYVVDEVKETNYKIRWASCYSEASNAVPVFYKDKLRNRPTAHRVLNLGTTQQWAGGFTSRLLYHQGKQPGTEWTAGWASPGDWPDTVKWKKKLLALLETKFRFLQRLSHILNHHTELAPGGPIGKQKEHAKQTLSTEFYLNPWSNFADATRWRKRPPKYISHLCKESLSRRNDSLCSCRGVSHGDFIRSSVSPGRQTRLRRAHNSRSAGANKNPTTSSIF